MTQGERFNSIDILKGFTVLFLLFANALCLPDTLPVFTDNAVHTHYVSISELAVISFIFMFGMTVPFTIMKKINDGLTSYEIARGIFSKTLVLLVIGIMMVNAQRVNAEFTGFNNYVYSILLFCAIFIVWFRYPDEEGKFFTVTGLRLLGLAMLVFLLFKFRSGTFENGGSVITGWWEIPGLIGWSYFVSGLTYLLFRNSLTVTSFIWLAFLLVYILSGIGMTRFLDPAEPYIGPVIKGCFPFIMLSGHLASVILRKYSDREFRATATGLAVFAFISAAAGVVLGQTLLKAHTVFNPSLTLTVIGILILVFLLLHRVADIKNYGYLFGAIKPAGVNYLTAYLFPYLIYNLLFLAGTPLFFFRSYGNAVNMLASFAIAFIMLILSLLAIKMNVRLKI